MKPICEYITEQEVKRFCEPCKGFCNINGCEIMRTAYKRKLEDARNQLRIEGSEIDE